MASFPGQRAGSPPTGPTTPASLTVSIVSSGVQLSWNSSFDGDVPVSYIITRCSGPSCTNFSFLAQTASGVVSYTDTTTASFTSYSYIVQATDPSGNVSGNSNIASITTPDITAPTVPVLSETTTNSSTSLSWTASTDPDGNLASYIVSRSINNGPFVQLATVNQPTTTYLDSGLSQGSSYTYFVQSKDSVGNISAPSNMVTNTIADTTPPSVPAGLTATPVSGTQVNLSWTASTDVGGVVAKYTVIRNGSSVATVAAPTTTYSDTGLTQNTTYSYQVSATDNSNNVSAPCTIVQATTFDTQPPTTPGSFTATVISSTEIDLSWTASTDNVSVAFYTITRNSGNFSVNVTAPATSYKDQGLTPSTLYSYTISATDPSNNTSGTATASATTQSGVVSSFSPPYPRVGFMGIGSPTSTLNQYNNVGGILNLYGKYNIFVLGGDFEGWTQNAGGGDRQTMVSTIKTNSTAPLGTKVLIYGEQDDIYVSSDPYPTWTSIVNANNWKLYASGSSGTLVTANAGANIYVNYAADSSGNPYAGRDSAGESPAQLAAHYQYYYKLNKTRTGTDASRFAAVSALDAAPSLDGIQIDNLFVDPRVAGDWQRNGTQSTHDNGLYQGIWSDILAKGQRQFFDTMSALIAVNSGTQWLCGNAGDYARADLNNNQTTAGAMWGVLNYSFFESAFGKSFSIETQQNYANMQLDYAALLNFLKNPQAGMINCCLPNGTAAQSGNLPWSATQTAVNGEYQWARYMLTSALMNNGYCAIQYQTSGYNPNATDLTWYDEFDNAGATKGYLGTAIDAPQTTIRTWYNGTTIPNVWAREFTGGLAIVVAKTGTGTATQPTGTITITGAQLGIGNGKAWKYITGTQAPAVNKGTAVTSAGVTLQASRDGLILLNNVPAPPAITTTSPLAAATVGTVYSATLAATGGVPPYTWSVISDTPDTGSWLSLNSSTGVLSGTPTTAETETLTVRVTDSFPQSSQQTFSLTVNASGSAFMTDPYSSYTQFWLDPLNGNDSNSGTSQGAAKKTLQAGVNLLTQGGSRLNVLNTATLNVPATVNFPPTSNTSANARIVVMGLASYTATQLPKIVMAAGTQIFVNANNVADYVTFRKLDISGSGTVSTPDPGANSLIVWLTTNTCQSPLVQYCNLHNQVSTDITAGIRIEGAHPNAEFSYNKIHDITNSTGSVNGTGIITYQTPAVQCHHNDIYNCPTLIYVKRCSAATANNGWLIHNNILRNTTTQGVFMAEQASGDTDGFFDTAINNNLFYAIFTGINQSNQENTLQSSRCTVSFNTFAQDCTNAFGFRAMTAIDCHSNVFMPSSIVFSLQDASSPNGFINSFSECDYDAYYTVQGQSWKFDTYGTNAATFTTLSSFKTAHSVSNRPELTADPEAHGTTFTSLATTFPNSATRDYTLASNSPLKGTGKGGVDPGYTPTDIGPGW